MGEILYRGKKKNWNELSKEEQRQWIEGYYCKRKYTDAGSEEEYKDCIVKEFSDKGINFTDVDPETVCQYTGRTDKNDQKIFRGDIVKVIKVNDFWTGFVSWDFNDTVFDVEHCDDKIKYVEPLGSVLNGNIVEVIGNIFDDADLIPFRVWNEMSETLYRGKKKNWNELPKEEQQWIEGYYCKRKSGHYTDAGSEEEYKDCIVKEFSDKGINFADVDPETVCQYTGWTDDVNEKKIFEGNIIKVDDWWTGFIYWNFNDTVFEVYPYDEFSNRSIWGYVERLGCVCNGNIVEVIGNIFDNTDLMPKDADLDLVKSHLRGSLK